MANGKSSSLRPTATGFVVFGMLSVPVKFYKATDEKGVGFNQLHNKCQGRINQKIFCPKCDEIVDRGDLLRGFEIKGAAKGASSYTIITDADLATIDPDGDKRIEIIEFAPRDRFESIALTGTVNYLGCDLDQPVDAYRVLAAAMEQQKLAAVVRLTRNKVRYAMLEAVDGVLVLSELHYLGEIRNIKEAPHPDEAKPDKAHLDLAKQLIASMTVAQPTLQYEDTYLNSLLELIDKKTAGAATASNVIAMPPRKTADILEALKASLATNAAKPAKGKGKKAA